MTEGERVKAIRDKLHLTMEGFGAPLGITSSAVGNIEKGRRRMSEQVRLAICREFNISEAWLRTGEGEMYVLAREEFDDDVQALAKKYKLPPESYALAKAYIELNSDQQKAVINYAKKVAAILGIVGAEASAEIMPETVEITKKAVEEKKQSVQENYNNLLDDMQGWNPVTTESMSSVNLSGNGTK